MASVYTPKTSSVDALWALIQSQTSSVRETLYKRIIEAEEKRKTQQQEEFVRKSLTKALAELNDAKDNIERLPNARDLFEIMDAK